MRKLYYLAWIPIISFFLGLGLVIIKQEWGYLLISPLAIMVFFAIFSRKLIGARCARCGRPIPKTSALVDYCQNCSKRVKV